MSKCFSLQILLPIEGYEEDRIYDANEIELKGAYSIRNPDNVFYRRMKEKSIYASMTDIIEFVKQKYSLEEINNYSMRRNYFGEYEVNFQGKQYIVEEDEVKQLEKEHIHESVYCNEFKSCSLSWFYTSSGNELVTDDMVVVDDDLIHKASELLGYKSQTDLAVGLSDVMEDDANGEDKFMASLILAKEIANRVNGKAVLRYE